MALRPGDIAPPIDAQDTQGNTFSLADRKGKKNVVVFFFPRAFTPGCTTEVCSFRDAYDELADSADVVGISTDPVERQAKFAGVHRLQFPLLGDPEQRISKAYGAIGLFRSILGLAQRVTFVIDKAGVVRGVFKHELDAARHVADVRQALATLT